MRSRLGDERTLSLGSREKVTRKVGKVYPETFGKHNRTPKNRGRKLSFDMVTGQAAEEEEAGVGSVFESLKRDIR